MIPENYRQWRQCIEKDCGIQLTPAYARVRIAALHDTTDPHTLAFIKLYGAPYAQTVTGWFAQFLHENETNVPARHR